MISLSLNSAAVKLKNNKYQVLLDLKAFQEKIAHKLTI